MNSLKKMNNKGLYKYVRMAVVISILLFASGANYAQNFKDTVQNNTKLENDGAISQDSVSYFFQEIFESVENALNEGISRAIPFSTFKFELIVFILLLSIVLFILGIVRGRRGNILEGKLHTINVVLICTIFLAELFYVFSLGANASWFCKPKEVGWIFTIINFTIFSLVLLNQIFRYLHTLQDLQYHSYAVFSWKIGLFSFPISLVLALIAAYFYTPAIPFIFIGLLVVQLIQLVILFKNVLPQGGFFHALVCAKVYLLGAIATLALVFHFIPLFVAALLIVGIIYLFIGGLSSGKSVKQWKFCTFDGRRLDFSGRCGLEGAHGNNPQYCGYCGKKLSNCLCN
jgi:hypothetical protein